MDTISSGRRLAQYNEIEMQTSSIKLYRLPLQLVEQCSYRPTCHLRHAKLKPVQAFDVSAQVQYITFEGHVDSPLGKNVAPLKQLRRPEVTKEGTKESWRIQVVY